MFERTAIEDRRGTAARALPASLSTIAPVCWSARLPGTLPTKAPRNHGNGVLLDAGVVLEGQGFSHAVGAGDLVARQVSITGVAVARWIATGALDARASTVAGVGLTHPSAI